MNCHNFESVITDLARDQMMDATTKINALAHASDCARCAARLADERMLTAGLHRLAESAQDEHAPQQIEAMLCAAFREQPAEAISSGVALQSKRASGWPRWVTAAAVAAILVMLALVALRFNQSQEPERATTPEEKPMQQPKENRPNETAPKPSSPAVKPYVHARNNKQREPKQAKRAVQNKPQTEKLNASRNNTDAQTSASEIATDFIPLMYGSNLNQMDGGQVVRVELPRSALVSFGLPMNMERAGERVKADVVIGNDGLAHAIRFVR